MVSRLRLPLIPLLLCAVVALFPSTPRPPLARAAGHNVSHLPGFHGPLPFRLETGYVGLDDPQDVQFFYYFVPSERDPVEDPLLLWLTGGPGCSGLCTLTCGIGPLRFLKVRYDGSIPGLVLNPHPWTKVASIIFVDSPAGAGFSFSRKPADYYSTVGDLSSGQQNQIFIRKWLEDHPQFKSNPFYVGGDSYGGKDAPIAAHFIAEGIRAGDKPLVNLKGYVIGNPITGENRDYFFRIPFLHAMGIISDEIYELTMKNCEGQDYLYPETAGCAKNLDVVKNFLSEINTAFILDPRCPLASPRSKSIEGDRRSLQVYSTRNLNPPPVPDVKCTEYSLYLTYYWANNDAARKALRIKKGTVDEWQRCSDEVSDHYAQDVESAVTYHFNLTSRGYRALVYSGDHDAIMPSIGTHAWIRSLNFSVVDDWRSWHVDGQVAGYTTSYSNNLTFATVKGAGHVAPEYRPRECFAMFQRWISQDLL